MSTRDGCDILLEVAEKASLAMTANSEPPNYTMHPPNASNYRGELQDQGPTTLAPSTSESFLPVSSPYSFSTEVGRTTGLGVPSSYLPVSSHGVYSMGMRNDTTSQARSIDRINEDDSYVPSYIPSVPSTSINMAPARDLLTSSRTTNGNANSTINETQENYNDAADDDGLYSDEAATNTSNNTGEIQYQGPFLLAPSTSGSFLPVSSSPCSFTTEVKRTTGLGVPPSFLPVSSRGVYSMGMRNDTTSQARSIDRINEHDSYIPYVPFLPATPINMAPARDLLTSSRTTNGNANSTINETQENYNDAADDDGLYSDEAREAMIRDRIRRERNREYARQSRARKRKEIEALHEFESTLRESLTKAERQVCTLQEGYAKVQQELEETRQACSLLEQEHAKLRERITRSEYDNSRLNAW
eukprot:CAMPEP_0197340512 /NCGR_PEP_ID=MMETSP0892-20130614/45710_1 /TAXON_ID=44058 ORGANISM="Aureoumbra lagunensis, Strain CCMP1510" /NCGR_SAMPLE_ID=MMETSP0892 /ASSEMBLY_ACC=CAM_ASM_000538 /LENGTH=415 /DNA_ID=CAMNT_0042845265 /DNA_START=34 /DNA_END=1277 /DNA_ORIENTATION=-